MEPERTTDSSDRETPPQAVWVRLSRYLVGDLTDREQAGVEHWLAADPHRATAVAELQHAWEQRTEPSNTADVERALRAVTHQIGLTDQPQASTASKPGRPIFRQSATWTFRQRRWSPAVALVLGVIVALIGWHTGARTFAQRAAHSTLTYTTANGERARR